MGNKVKIADRRLAVGVDIKHMGLIEIGGIGPGLRYRWVDGYAVVLDGRPCYPWTCKREAVQQANIFARNRGAKI